MKPIRAVAAAALALASLSVHAVGELADVRIHDRTSGRELPVYWHEGRAYVVGKPGNEYRVAVRNRRGEDLLAVVSVDGVNVVSGETASPRQGGYVLAPWQQLDVRGWRKSLGEIASFYFTSLGDSYAARTGRPDNVGVIGVALFRRMQHYPEPWRSEIAPSARDEGRHEAPAQAPGAAAAESFAQKRALPAPGAPLGTGHGRREHDPAQWTHFERATPHPVETIAIHYDSYRNLVARGIVPPTHAAPRNPQPFPGFVPDPWR